MTSEYLDTPNPERILRLLLSKLLPPSTTFKVKSTSSEREFILKLYLLPREYTRLTGRRTNVLSTIRDILSLVSAKLRKRVRLQVYPLSKGNRRQGSLTSL